MGVECYEADGRKQDQLIRLCWKPSVHAVSPPADTEDSSTYSHTPATALTTSDCTEHGTGVAGARAPTQTAELSGSLKPKLWISDSVKDGAVVGGRAHGVGGDGRLAGACQVQLHHEISHQER